MQELPIKLSDCFLWVFVAMLLYIVDIPGMGYLRIDGMALLVVLISIYRPLGFPLTLAFVLGLLQDIVSLAPLGQHAIGLAVLAYLAQSMRDRIRIQKILMQLPSIFIALLLVKFIHAWVLALGFRQLPSMSSFLSVLVTTALWPLAVALCARLVRNRRGRQYGIVQ